MRQIRLRVLSTEAEESETLARLATGRSSAFAEVESLIWPKVRLERQMISVPGHSGCIIGQSAGCYLGGGSSHIVLQVASSRNRVVHRIRRVGRLRGGEEN